MTVWHDWRAEMVGAVYATALASLPNLHIVRLSDRDRLRAAIEAVQEHTDVDPWLVLCRDMSDWLDAGCKRLRKIERGNLLQQLSAAIDSNVPRVRRFRADLDG